MHDLNLITSDQLKKRHVKETRFQWYGRIAILISLSFLVFMFVAIVYRGAGAFQQTKLGLDIDFEQQLIDPAGTRDAKICLLYTSPSPRDQRGSRMPSSA